MINIHDLRNLKTPVSSILAHPSGISSASFQAHSGLMSTTSNLNPSATHQMSTDPFLTEGISGLSMGSGRPTVNFGLYRSTDSSISLVTADHISFDVQSPDVAERGFRPYTVVHSLRPFVGIGYGRTCYLRGSGIGRGDDTDSGSYSFLSAQAKFNL